MSDYFTLARYYHQYIAALTDRNHIAQRLEGLKSYGLLFVEDEGSYCQWKAEIAAAEAELKAADEEAARLYCLSTCGKLPDQQTDTYRPIGLQPPGHWPELSGREYHRG